MSQVRTVQGTSAFAHLLGLGTAARRAVAAEGDPKDPKDPDAAAADGTKKCPDCDGTGENADGSECETCDGTGVVDEDYDGTKAGKAKGDTDEECAEEKDDDQAKASAARAGRAFERARCAAIFGAPAAGQRPDVAGHLAFETAMAAPSAIALLGKIAGGQVAPRGRQRLDDRMAAVRVANPGSTAPAAPSGPTATAAMIIAAGKRRRGET